MAEAPLLEVRTATDDAGQSYYFVDFSGMVIRNYRRSSKVYTATDAETDMLDPAVEHYRNSNSEMVTLLLPENDFIEADMVWEVTSGEQIVGSNLQAGPIRLLPEGEATLDSPEKGAPGWNETRGLWGTIRFRCMSNRPNEPARYLVTHRFDGAVQV